LILLLTNSFDEHADSVEPILKSKGCQLHRLNVDHWRHCSLSFRPTAKSYLQILGRDNFKLLSNEVAAVWYRRPCDLLPATEPESVSDKFAQGEWKHALEWLYVAFNDSVWVNDINKLRIASSKAYQLRIAKMHGLAIPKTIITNNPREVEEFAATFDGPLAYKPLHSFSKPSDDHAGLLTIFTNIVPRKMIKSCAAQIERAPCIFQEYVKKKYELRLTVIGQDIYCAAIPSQDSERSSIDWRRYDLANTPYEPYILPTFFKKKIHQFMAELGLVFGCLDFIVTPDDKFVFLEINPNGQWLWVEKLTGMPIAESMAQLLAGFDNSRWLSQRRERVVI
jgi:hypothetical protein